MILLTYKKSHDPMLSSSTKTSLYPQDGCGKYLGYQSLKDLEIER